jgi:hypothetical protein
MEQLIKIYEEVVKINLKQNINEIFKEELDKIRVIKLEKIVATIVTLHITNNALLKYIGIQDDINFIDYFNNIAIKEQALEAKHIYGFLWPKSKGDIIISYLPLLLSLDYEPPSDIEDICDHLRCLWFNYQFPLNVPPTLSDLRLDLSLSKLLQRSLATYYVYFRQGQDHIARLKSSKRKIQAKHDAMEDHIYEAFYRLDIKGMSFNKIAKYIQDKLIENGIYVKPSPGQASKDYTKTIKRYMQSMDKIRDDLINMGVIKGQK